MIKYFCDCCGKEIPKGKSLNTFSYHCHLDSLAEGNLKNQYIDGDRNPISGRSVERELCNKCYNLVLIESVKKFNELKNYFF
jgi:hypothetical protein